MLGGSNREMLWWMWWKVLWLRRRGGEWGSGFVVGLCGVAAVLWMLVVGLWLYEMLRGSRDVIVVRVVDQLTPDVRELWLLRAWRVRRKT